MGECADDDGGGQGREGAESIYGGIDPIVEMGLEALFETEEAAGDEVCAALEGQVLAEVVMVEDTVFGMEKCLLCPHKIAFCPDKFIKNNLSGHWQKFFCSKAAALEQGT